MKRIITLLSLVFSGVVLILLSYPRPQWSFALAGTVAFLIIGYSFLEFIQLRASSRRLVKVLDLSPEDILSAPSAGEEIIVVREAMQAFKQQLVELPGMKKKSRLPAEEFINRQTTLEKVVNLPAFEAVPNILIGTGILFTFVGIIVVLLAAGADVGSLSSTDPRKAQESLQNLFQAISIKFITSVAGIFCSSLLSLAIKNEVKQVAIACQAFASRLNEEFPVLTFEVEILSLLRALGSQETATSMREAATSLGQAAKALNDSSGALGEQMGRLVEAQERLTPEAIGRQVGQVLEDQFAPVFRDIRDSLQELHKIKAEQGQQIVEALMSELRTEVIEPVLAQMAESTNRTGEVADLVKMLQGTLEGSLTEAVKKLEKSTDTIQQFQTDTLQKLEGFAGKLANILGQFESQTRKVLESVAIEVKQATKAAIEGLETQRGAFQDSARQAAETFRGIRTELEQALEHQASLEERRLSEMSERIESLFRNVESAFQRQMDALEEIGAEASKGLLDARTRLLEGMGEIHRVLTNTSEVVREELHQFRIQYQEALLAFFAEQNNLLEGTLGSQREGLAQVVQDLKAAFHQQAAQLNEAQERFGSSIDRLIRVQEQLQKYSTAVGLDSGARIVELGELAQAIGSQAAQVGTQYENLVKAMDEAMRAFARDVNEFLERLKNGQSDYYEKHDKALDSILGRIMDAAEILVEAKQIATKAG